MNDLRTAAQQLLGALDKSLYMNDYCGLEVSKHDQPDVTDAIENLRAALAEPVQELGPWTLEQCDRVIRTLRYIEGIAARGEGRPMREDETLEQFILGYVQKLEAGQPAALAEPQEPDSPARRCGGPGCDMTCCQPVQEPVGAVLVNRESREGVMFYSVDMIPDPSTLKDRFELVPVYTTPPQRLPLTDEEIERLWYPSAVIAEPGKRRVAFGRAVERAHGIGGE